MTTETTEKAVPITLPAALLRAAAVCSAKGDMSYYLNGVHLNPAGFVESSDGHTAFRAECAQLQQLPTPLILDIDGAIPASADRAYLQMLPGDDDGYMHFTKSSGKPVESKGFPVRRWFRLVDGKFPDVSRVIPEGKPEPTARIAFNTGYLNRLEKIASAMVVRYPLATLELHGDNGVGVAIIPHPEHPAQVLIMPARL